MSQSRFSIVLVGVSALLRRPLVSRLRPADGERSPWVVFTARGGRFDSGFRSASWPSGSPLPLFGTHRFGDSARRVGSSTFRFGVAAGRVRSSAFRFGVAAQRVGLRGHRFRFSACAASEWLLGELVLPPSASEIALGGLAFGLPLPLFGMRRFGDCRSASWPSGSLLPLFGMRRFGDCPRRIGLRASASEIAAGRVGLWAHCFRFSACSASEIALGGLAFGLTASAFRHAPIRGCPRRAGSSAGRVGLRVHCFRFSARTASEIALGGLAFGPPLPLFGMHRSAPPHRRSEDRRSTTTRHLFHFKTLIPTC